MDISALLPEAIEWSEGMLLAPQHLQQNDIYWHHQLRHQLALLQPHYWGLIELRHEEQSLQSGKIQIESLHAVMPDGLVVQFPGLYDAPLALDLKTIEGWKGEKPLRIFLAVPVRSEGAASRTSHIQRFDPVPGKLAVDENTGEGNIEVERLRPRLLLLAGERVPAKYTAFPLMDIVVDAGGHFRVGSYHPPMLRLGACDFLGSARLDTQLLSLVDGVRAKIRDLAGSRRIDADLSKLDPEARQQLFVCRHLASALPPLELRLRSGACHPYDIYLALAALVGQLASVGANPSPPMLSPYRHEDFLGGFAEAIGFIKARLALIVAPFESLLFEQTIANRFARHLSDDLPADRLIVELRPHEGQTPQQLEAWMAQAHVATSDLIPILQQRRLLGAGRRRLDPRRASRLNPADGALVFELTNKLIEVGDVSTPFMRSASTLVIQAMTDLDPPRELVLHLHRFVPGSHAATAEAEDLYPEQAGEQPEESCHEP